VIEYDILSYWRYTMASAKIAITMDESTLHRLDRLVKDRIFPNRSKAIQNAVEEKLKKLERNRLSRECAKLDPVMEKSMAEEGLGEELEQWPEY
jgi:metal-responsive CopG/Arc/MetJ family transcriptional regulator